MLFTVHLTDPAAAPVVVDADEHRVEGGCHVLRATATVMGRPRPVVVLRLPVAEVDAVLAPEPPSRP